MANPTWIIEETAYQNDFNSPQRFNYLLQELGCKVITFKYIPFEGTDLSFIPNLEDGPVIFYGTLNALAFIRENVKNLPEPFAWCDHEAVSCENYYEKLKPFILAQNHKFLTLNELDNPEFAAEIFQQYGRDNVVFFRPNDNEKTFTGTLVRQSNMKMWRKDLTDRCYVPDDLKIIASTPQQILYEWRFVLVEGKVVAGSQYMSNGFCDVVADYPKEAAEFAEAAAAQWSPHPVFVVDVGEVKNQGYRVVEIGPFHYAGMYMCDLRPIATSINKLFES